MTFLGNNRFLGHKQAKTASESQPEGTLSAEAVALLSSVALTGLAFAFGLGGLAVRRVLSE